MYVQVYRSDLEHFNIDAVLFYIIAFTCSLLSRRLRENMRIKDMSYDHTCITEQKSSCTIYCTHLISFLMTTNDEACVRLSAPEC